MPARVRDGERSTGPFGGLFLIALSSLLYELLLTRVISVSMWYHFAIVVISITMFGMTAGSLTTYLLPKNWKDWSEGTILARAAQLFAATAVISYLAHLAIPVAPEISLMVSVVGAAALLLQFFLLALPFFFAGFYIARVLGNWPAQVHRLYAVDLLGAALGGLLFVFGLRVSDAATLVLLTAFAGWLASLMSGRERLAKRPWGEWLTGALLVVLLLLSFGKAQQGRSLVPFLWLKGIPAEPTVTTSWTENAYVEVLGDSSRAVTPISWGYSPGLIPKLAVRELMIRIDGSALTPMIGFDGDLSKVNYLSASITNLVHRIRGNGDVFIIGPGGGRDILSALMFEQKHVTGVEINPDIVRLVKGQFAHFTGNLAARNDVELVHDNARHYLQKEAKRYDIIQASFVDTWAATAAGAYTLAENDLYTREAFSLYLDRLNPDGVVTVSRWYGNDIPGEMYRLVRLATVALLDRGIKQPRRHLMVVRVPYNRKAGVGTLLMSRDPFGVQDIQAIEEVSRELGFQVVMTPDRGIDPTMRRLATEAGAVKDAKRLGLTLDAPTDNRPFFFNMVRFRDVFRSHGSGGMTGFNYASVSALLIVLLIATLLSAGTMLIGWKVKRYDEPSKGRGALIGYFALIGTGFMVVEVALMQKLKLLLGNPTSGILLVLILLLIGAGIGSMLSGRLNRGRAQNWIGFVPGVALALVGLVLLRSGSDWRMELPLEATLLAISILPLGVTMGWMFPTGVKLAGKLGEGSLVPVLYGVNGALSVFASVAALALSIGIGIRATFGVGVVAYLLAGVLLMILGRKAGR